MQKSARAGRGAIAGTRILDGHSIATYRVYVDCSAREEIATASAVHRDLGPDYADAVAEGLVERISSEIDKRLDARLAQRAAPQAPRSAGGLVALGLGSMMIGFAATLAVLFAGVNIGSSAVDNSGVFSGSIHNSVSGEQVLLVGLIWAAIAIVNFGYARRH